MPTASPPVALILFSNDLDRFLPNVERERQLIEEALEHYNDTNRLKVITRSSVSVEEIFRLFNRYQGRIALFHFAGHAGGEGLQLNREFADKEQGRATGLAGLFRREVAEGLLQLVFLNGCSTNPQLDLLREAGVPTVISTRFPIDDRKALHFARQFYRALANADRQQPFEEKPTTVGEAFQQALAYLKTIEEVAVEDNSRGILINLRESTAAEPAWTLYSNQPTWTLSAEVAQENKAFNELLTRELMEAVQLHSIPAQKFLSRAVEIPGWEGMTNPSDSAKDILAFSFVGVLGIQLRKLFAIGKLPPSEDKHQQYLTNCVLTGKRALQLLSFALLSQLWDRQREQPLELNEAQRRRLQLFFEDQIEPDLLGYLDLLRSLHALFADRGLTFPLEELADFAPNLEEESGFVQACRRLQELNGLLEKSQFRPAHCFSAERQLSILLGALRFLAAYRMVSIKSIAYDEMRNAPPRYLHSYTVLGIDSKRNVNTERINYTEEKPVSTHAILLFKGRYQQSINLFPFVIDVNALTFEGGAKVCFYSGQDIHDGSLNYRFQEDNSLENITYKNTLAREADINQLMLDPQKQKDLRLDFVFQQFQEAKKAILGTAVEAEDFLAGADDDYF